MSIIGVNSIYEVQHVVLGVERPNNSRKARKIRSSPFLSPMTTLSPHSHLSLNLQIVCTSWTPLQTFRRTPGSLHILLQHLPSDLLLLKKLLAPSCSLRKWVLRLLLKQSILWILLLPRFLNTIFISMPHTTIPLHLLSNL